ncbi:hypothetical protein OIE66_42565 [Nonomuraea sp. NBC_01738]|uniref:hypothetical protein n=1 Tax=Nonomuraea sp. NBC_01738 TaxID=2976003 RepID=UPI002E14843D|nr:hypothetical protein OIE66_42565 [Nonomuraea sp. NBC_01738]
MSFEAVHVRVAARSRAIVDGTPPQEERGALPGTTNGLVAGPLSAPVKAPQAVRQARHKA